MKCLENSRELQESERKIAEEKKMKIKQYTKEELKIIHLKTAKELVAYGGGKYLNAHNRLLIHKVLTDYDELLEKEKPKKVIFFNSQPLILENGKVGTKLMAKCSGCGNLLGLDPIRKYCCECGHKLEWSGENE